MILYCRIDLKELQASEKKYFWKKPFRCPACYGNRLWGHGFVTRYFHGYTNGFWIKRYRCPDCGAVHTARPVEYPLGFQYPWKEIRESVKQKTNDFKFLSHIPRQNQQYWYKTWKFQMQRNSNWLVPDPVSISRKNVTFRLNYREIPHDPRIPHLLFAVTVRPLRI